MATLTIASGQTTSDAVNLASIGHALVGLVTPATLTGTAFTFSVSQDGTTYNTLYDKNGSSYSVTVAASRYILLPPADFAGIGYLKIVSGSTEGGTRSIVVVTRPV